MIDWSAFFFIKSHAPLVGIPGPGYNILLLRLITGYLNSDLYSACPH